jgi:hypothetical protein
VVVAPVGVGACEFLEPPPPMALNTDATYETTVPTEPDTVAVVGDLQPPEEIAERCDDGTAGQKIDELRGNIYALQQQQSQAAAAHETGAVTAIGQDIEYDQTWIKILTREKPCPPPETPSATTGPPGSPEAMPGDKVTPWTTIGSIPVMAASAQVGYAHYFSSSGEGTDALTIGGQTLLGGSSYGLVGGPKGSATPWHQGDLELQGAWGESFTGGQATSAGQFNAGYLMNVGSVRFGPVGGYQGSVNGGYRSQTSTYGGYADAFLSDQFGLFARGGGFNSDPGYGGYYVGGGARWNPCPRLTLTGGADYGHWSTTDGYFQVQATGQTEYQPWPAQPISIYAGYTYAQSGYDDFMSYHTSSNEVFVGVRVWAGGPKVMTLEDHERNGPVIGLMPTF